MNWRGGEHERFPVRPLTTPAKDLPAYLRHGVHAYSRMEDLSLTATRMSSFGIPLLPTNPRERRLHSSHSDTKAIQMMKSNKDTILLKRIGSLESARTLKFPPPLTSTVRPPSGAILPPIMASSDQLVCETSTVTNNSDCKTRIEEEIDEQIEEEDSSNEVDSSDENLIDDDNSEIDELPPSGIGFRDESYSSLTSLIDVDFPQVSSGHLPYPATLLQEHLLLEHQAHTAGLQSGLNPRVNNIVRAFEIKGPLDKDLLQCALNNVVNIHPILSSKFILRINNKFYVQTSQGPVTAQLDLTTSYEKPSELVTLARRKVFHIPIKQQQQQQHDLQSSNATGPMTCTGDSFDDSLSIVSYKSEISPKLKPRIVSFQESSHLPSLNCLNEPPSGEDYSPLVRVKLVTKSPQDFILIISFPNIVCDYWSSCLFIQQLTNAYSKLEKSSSYRPSLTALTQIRKRQETFNALEMRRAKTSYGKTRPTTKLLQRRAQINQGGSDKGFTPICPPRCYFQQVGLRESQILLSYPKEKLWMFWETMVTATIKRLRGPPRVKVIPPIRIPSGLGEITRTSRAGRPTTSRLRPLTARNRPVTASRRVGGLTDGFSQESLSGPKRDSLSIKVEENIGLTIVQSFPEEYLAKIDRKELLGLTCLSVYVLLLGRCCRGWSVGGTTLTTTEQDHLTQPVVSDPLQKYQQEDERSPHVTRSPIKRRGCKLDVGSFLIGVEISLRQQAPELTQGLFGPLTNTVGVRVDLSSYQSFADLVLSLWRSVHSGRCHSHYPFSTIADELGLVQGLPVHFSYLYPHDVQQLSNPDEFYFIETSVGVEKKALARFGTCCYIDPLNTKMDDSCQLELFMWEGVRGESIDGLLLYQPHLLKHDIVKAFSKEMIQLLQIVSTNPTISLVTLASKIHPPFLHSRSRERRK